MTTADPRVDDYLRTARRWPDELVALRALLTRPDLTEALKWNKPCWTHGGRNVAIAQEMTDLLALMFFQGALLADPDGLLEDQGPNSRSARRVAFRSVADVERLGPAVGRLVDEAVAVATSGATVGPAPEAEVPAELRERLDADPALAAAWSGLTPGRRREHALFVGGAKRSETRAARVDRQVGRILDGRGLRDR